MLSKRMEELAAQKAKLVELENAVIAERDAQLQSLHKDLGFASRAELVAALDSLGAAAPKKRGRKKKAGRPAKAAKAPRAAKAPKAPKAAGGRGKKRRKRTTITPELRKSIEGAARAGKTGASIAKEFGVSLPTVQNIKRAAGLTRSR